MTDKKLTPVLFCDLDGTTRKGKDQLGRFVNTPSDVEVFPEAIQQMDRWRRAGGRVVGVTNQGGIALGIVDESNIVAAITETDRRAHYLFDLIRHCPHHPDVAPCWCRKPSIGMLVDAMVILARHYPDEEYPHDMLLLTGDRPEDEQCARNAGIKFLIAEAWRAGDAEVPRNSAAVTWPDKPAGGTAT